MIQKQIQVDLDGTDSKFTKLKTDSIFQVGRISLQKYRRGYVLHTVEQTASKGGTECLPCSFYIRTNYKACCNSGFSALVKGQTR